MAKKKPVAAAQDPTARIGTILERANFAEAWKLVLQLGNPAVSDDHLAIARNVVKQACEHFADANRPADFAKFFGYAAALPKGEGSDWIAALGFLQARAGYFTKAKELLDPLNDPTATTKALGLVADKAVASGNVGLLPPDYQPAYDAILVGFRHYQSGSDEAARESLNAVGLQSPYLDWKVLLRGLIAFTAGDGARAIENFARLNADRLPGRIAGIIRTKIDPQYRSQLPTETAAHAERAYRGSTTGTLLPSLKSIQEKLGRGKSLAPAFTALETALPILQSQQPDLLPRLANCFYHAILQQGHPDDLKRYRKMFGVPKEDPQFNRLQGIILEQTDQLEESLNCWLGYSDWLKTPPTGWPAVLATRVRAQVLYRMGNLAIDLEELGDEPDDDLFDFFGPVKKKAKVKAPRNRPDPKRFFADAVEAAPDWEQPSLEVFDRVANAGDRETAEIAAKALLHHNPGSLAMLDRLAALYGEQGRAADCLDCRRKVLAANPLDKTANGLALRATVALARRRAAQKDYVAAEELLGTVPAYNDGNPHYAEILLRAAIARKLGRVQDAARHLAAIVLPQAVLLRQFMDNVHAVVLKSKPAEKKAAVAEFAQALKNPQLPIAWYALFAEMTVIEAEGWNFTGEAALRKKILAAIAGSAQAGFEADSEGLALFLEECEEWPTLQKLAAGLVKCYPRNPFFLLSEVEAALAQKTKKPNAGVLSRKLYKAEDLIGLTPQSRHAHLLPRIQRLLSDLNPMNAMFNSFFRPR